MPAIINFSRSSAPAAAPPRRIRIDESVGVIGTATGGNAATALPENEPLLFRQASVQSAALTGAAITRAIADEDWAGVFWRAAEAAAGLGNTLDPTIRKISVALDDEIIAVKIPPGTGGAPPTNESIEAGIAAMNTANARLGRKPGIIIIPEFTVPRADSGDYAPEVPGGGFAALGFLSELDGLAQDNGAIALICGAGNYTRANAVDWAEANRSPHIEALWPRVRGSDGTVANSEDTSVDRAIAVLEHEKANSGRGTPLSIIPAPGVTGTVPGITQGLQSTTADSALLTSAGVTTLIHFGRQFWFAGGNFNQDLTGGPDLTTEVISTQRLIEEIINGLELIAFEALTSGHSVSPAFFELMENRGTAYLNQYTQSGRLQRGSVSRHPTTPVVNHTTPQFQVRLALYADAQAMTIDLIPAAASLAA